MPLPGQLIYGNDRQQGGVLDGLDELVDQGRYHAFEGLRQDDVAHSLKSVHADAQSCLGLAPLNRENPGADDFGNVGAFVEGESDDTGYRRKIGIEPVMKRQNHRHCKVDIENLDNEGQASEYVYIGFADLAKNPGIGQFTQGKEETHHRCEKDGSEGIVESQFGAINEFRH